ncbi:MAG: abortive infection system antitoxin AbiGi family protein [Janthinobacterium lividum]
MAVSSKSIIHYTENLDTLKSIISDGHLRLKYCLEELKLFGKRSMSGAYPMVCFCDLPLTMAKEHIKKYGSYGIGFSKEWARTNQLNPVFYLEANSNINKYITEQSDEYIKNVDVKKVSKEELANNFKLEQEFARLTAFCKNHEGPLIRKGKPTIKNYTFYDEREWRYVPDSSLLGPLRLALNADNYLADKERYNQGLQAHNLCFEHSDISYIIVKNESDIDAVSMSLTAKYAEDLNLRIMRKLLTKIISVQQIEDDF